jgi:hypothetical protein
MISLIPVFFSTPSQISYPIGAPRYSHHIVCGAE